MYCPHCGAQNADGTKFCRSCGTDLRVVSLALANPNQLDVVAEANASKEWLVKRREGISTLIKGTGLVSASLLVGVALGVFSNTNDWIILWLGLAGWMACWGIILWSQGINKLIESQYLRRELLASDQSAVRVTHQFAAREQAALPEPDSAASTTTKLRSSSSVTEHTTELLNK